MTEHRYDTNWDMENRNSAPQPNPMVAVIILLALGIGIAAAMAMLSRPKKKPGLAGEIEDRMSRLEKDLSHLSKRLQERIKELT